MSEPTKDEQKLTFLIGKRENLFRRVQTAYDVLKQARADSTKLPVFAARYKLLDETYEEFKNIVDNINILNLTLNQAAVPDFKTVEAFEGVYFQVKAQASSLFAAPDDAGVNQSPVEPTVVQPRLPRIEIPKFDSSKNLGSHWISFYDQFRNLIHNRSDMSPSDKFQYLLSAVSGPASHIINSLPVSDANYPIVWQSLVSKYNNKRVLGTHLMEVLFNFKPLYSENALNLNKFLNTFKENVTALRALNIPNLSDFFLLFLALRCLPQETRKNFERVHLEDEIPSWDQLVKFIEGQTHVLEFSSPAKSIPPADVPRRDRPALPRQPGYFSRPDIVHHPRALVSSRLKMNAPPANHCSFPTPLPCPICKLPHSIYKCPEFLKMGHSLRLQTIQDRQLCVNCLKGAHSVDHCLSKTSCLTCGMRHHTQLHPPSSKCDPSFSTHSTSPPHHATSSLTSIQSSLHVSLDHQVTSGESSHSSSCKAGTVLLGTALVHVRGSDGAFQTVRALLDPGAQTSFITTACAQRLQLPLSKCNVPVSGLGQKRVLNTRGTTTCLIKPRQVSTPVFTTEAVVLPTITSNLPTFNLSGLVTEQFCNLELADPFFHIPSPIELLIAADIFPYIYTGERVLGQPSALHSIFGWVITGRTSSIFSPSLPTNISLCTTLDHLDNTLKLFWESEEPPEAPMPAKPDDILCENLYQTLHSRDVDGRYIVPLPFAPSSAAMPAGSYHHALSRLVGVERRLARHPDLKQAYSQFMLDYQTLGHMTEIVDPADVKSVHSFYIPHHAVFKEMHNLKKLRVVFDGSARVADQPSLNSLMLTGPKLQRDIADIICRFRLHTFVISADISKMYRQILIRPEDRRYQRILWRSSPADPVTEFTLNTITYGLSPSPYLALRTILQLTIDEGDRFPLAVPSLQRDIYVDDILTGASTFEATQDLKTHLIQLLRSGCFELRKWCSNDPRLLTDIPADHRETPVSFDPEGPAVVKVLGVQWDASTDSFSYHFQTSSTLATKRSILSYIASTWDPLGWLTPITFRCKYLIQLLWREGLGWDDPIPEYLAQQWQSYCLALSSITNIKITRLVLPPGTQSIFLLGFSDASERGYAAAVYFVADLGHGCTSNLLLSKSKVAPTKTLTIPRLELCGAVLLSKLIKFCQSSLADNISLAGVRAYTDSMTVLSWLRTPTYQLKTYVAARVSSILELTSPHIWHHVSSPHNPADLACRGLDPRQLVDNDLWWRGPPWILQAPATWPTHHTPTLRDLPELKRLDTVNSFVQTVKPIVTWPLINHYSSYNRLVRVTAWCLRFVHHLQGKKTASKKPYLTCSELQTSLQFLVKNVQAEHFSQDIQRLAEGQEAITPSLLKLRAAVDSFGLLTVGGRLKYAVPPDNLHPYILPPSSPLSSLLIDHYHKIYLHIGPRALQSLLSRQFWILTARKLIRSRLSKCLTCFRFRATPAPPLMGDLPLARVTQGRPFLNVGIDYGGPFLYKTSKLKRANIQKCYLCLFVCLATKAVHLELVSDLTTDALIAALDRFVSRRGLCLNIYSDCGTNLVGARNNLSALYKLLQESHPVIFTHLSFNRINWHFSPPAAPHFNGLSEAGIKSVKHHLKRVIGDQTLTFEEYYTLLTKIEAILNSRPLCSLSSDPGEVDVLTPGHFLTGAPLVSLPEHDLNEVPLNRLDRWQLIQRSTQHFWRRWSLEYLHTLQQRSKWFTMNCQLKPGELVLLIENNVPPQHWPLARIESTHPGKDGITRVATVRIAGRSEPFERPVIKLCPLPVN